VGSRSYTYDQGANGIGRRTGMSDASGSAAWLYDARGRMIQESKVITGAGTFVTQWGYNSADLVIWMKYPGNNSGGVGEQVNYTYHPQMALASVAGASHYVPSVTYDAAGRMRGLGRGGVLSTTHTYYPWNQQGGRLQRLSTPGLQDLSYVYDPAGNPTQIQDSITGESQVFTYDALNRLSTATVSNGPAPYSESYAYDSAGRLSSKSGLGSYTYDTTHKHAVASTANGWAYQYDPNGNQFRRDPPGAEVFDFAYDAENRLVEAKKNGVTLATFVYDGDGRRVKATLNGSTTVYIGDYFEWTGSTSTMVKYYYAGAQRVAMRQGSTLYYLLPDHLGSTSLTSDANGAKLAELRYRTWGETRYNGGSTPTRYQYTGQYSYTADFGLYFYNSRWYDPALGRFAQPEGLPLFSKISAIEPGVRCLMAWQTAIS
jgi:RHS repeat-associated protein